MSPFFSIRIYLLLLHPVPFHQIPPTPSVCPLYLLIIGSKQSRHFPHFQSTCCTSTWQKSFVRARNNPLRQSYYIFLPDKYLRRYPSSRWSLVLLQGLVGTYSARLPPRYDVISVWLREPWEERSRKKRKKKKTRLAKTELWNANWLGWNPSGEVESVSLHIFYQSGQIEGCGRESAAETGSRPKRYLSAPDSGYSQQP